MRTFLRSSMAAAVVLAAGFTVIPQAGALTPEEQAQFRTDPVGAIVWQGAMGSLDVLAADQGAYSALSMYAMGDPGTTYPGAFGDMDRCAKSLTSSSPVGALRFVSAAACLLANPKLKNAVSTQVAP